MTGRTGYSIGDYRDPEAELARLRHQAELVATEEEAAFVALGFPERGRVLDVGCGPGFVAARLRRTRPELIIVGVDRDPVALARTEGIETAVADASALPFRNDSFDFAYTRLLLRHLATPEAALAEMVRVVRPGGGMLAVDTDDDALVLHPDPVGFAAVRRARNETYRRRGADPCIARRLVGLFRASGLKSVQARPLVVASTSLGADVFAKVVLAPITDAVDEDLLPKPMVESAAAALGEWAGREDAFGMTTALVVSGTKP